MYYLLDKNHIPYKVELMEWSNWIESCYNKTGGIKHVRSNYIKKYYVYVSTVFLGLDHGFCWDEDKYIPILFETMIFMHNNPGHELNQYEERYHTWDEALKGHRRLLRLLIKTLRDEHGAI
jgi:hypothetical protein